MKTPPPYIAVYKKGNRTYMHLPHAKNDPVIRAMAVPMYYTPYLSKYGNVLCYRKYRGTPVKMRAMFISALDFIRQEVRGATFGEPNPDLTHDPENDEQAEFRTMPDDVTAEDLDRAESLFREVHTISPDLIVPGRLSREQMDELSSQIEENALPRRNPWLRTSPPLSRLRRNR